MHLLSALVGRLVHPHDTNTHMLKGYWQSSRPLRLRIICPCTYVSGGSAYEHIKMRNSYLKREVMRKNCGAEADRQRSYS